MDTGELITSLADLEEKGVRVYTTWPDIVVTNPVITKAFDILANRDQMVLICQTRDEFNPCMFCDDLGVDELKIKQTRWISTVLSSDLADGYKAQMRRICSFRMFTPRAICAFGDFSAEELPMVCMLQSPVSKLISELIGISLPVFFGSNVPGVIHPQCIKNTWTARDRIVLRTGGRAEIASVISGSS